LATIDCFYKLYWNTVINVHAKKLGLVGWNAIAWMIPLVYEKGRWEVARDKEWMRTWEVIWTLWAIVAK